MMKDINKEAYNNDTKEPADINLENRDQEIEFAQEPESSEVKPEAGAKPGPKMGGMIEQKDDLGPDLNENVEIKAPKGNQNILGEKNQKSQSVKRGQEVPNEIRKDTTNAGPMGLDPNA